MNFTDLRILKTQERLQNALLELLETKDLKAVTVKEICDKAGISRNAFYQHYGYKEDLYDQMVERATERIRDSLTPAIPDASKLRLFYEFLSAGMAAFIIKWVVEDGMSENRTTALLAGILLQPLTKMPEHLISL